LIIILRITINPQTHKKHELLMRLPRQRRNRSLYHQ